MQPGLIYFKTLRKCGIFGVMCEGVPRQVNFLIDEAVSTGKGANATIIYILYYFEHHGLQETDVHLNADNCARQNKNNNFLWYLAWRTLMKLHHSITLLISDSRTYKVCSGSLFWPHQEGIQTHMSLHFTNLRDLLTLPVLQDWMKLNSLGHTTGEFLSLFTTGLRFLDNTLESCQIERATTIFVFQRKSLERCISSSL